VGRVRRRAADHLHLENPHSAEPGTERIVILKSRPVLLNDPIAPRNHPPFFDNSFFEK
jgi:hypothetical protein